MRYQSWRGFLEELNSSHNHLTRDLKPYGICDACDKVHLINRVWRQPV